MILPFLATTALLAGQQQDAFGDSWNIKSRDGSYERFLTAIMREPLAPAKVDPKHEWGFNFMTVGYASRSNSPLQWELRFRTFYQSRVGTDIAPLATRALLRMWEYNYDRLTLDHAEEFRRLVDVYLCDQGKAGGEQMFLEDRFEPRPEGRPRVKANIIFIYQLGTFKNYVEMIRELSHEYGHATLPPVGGFSAPENWINGHLGEHLYMRWLTQDLASKKIQRYDTMGAELDVMRGYLDKNVTPLVRGFHANGPNIPAIKKKNGAAANLWLGMMLHAETVLPADSFRRALLAGGREAAEYVPAIADTARSGLVLNTAGLKGVKTWLPAGNFKLEGATVIRRSNGWAYVTVNATSVKLK